jgi:Ser/Thr protein kinase RdoA (MazF antagonist)
LVTEYVEPVPRQDRKEKIRDNGGIRYLGGMLAWLHTIARASGSPAHEGGAWHHLADGGPAGEIAAAVRLLTAAAEGLPAEDRAGCAALRGELESLDCGDGLPQTLVHPDFVLNNIVATADRGLVVVDWTGAGRAARVWPLAFFLFAEGAKNLARVDLVVAGYRRNVTLGPEELDRLSALARVRPTTLAVWSFCQGRQSIAETLAEVAEVAELAEVIGTRARAAFAAPRRRG